MNQVGGYISIFFLVFYIVVVVATVFPSSTKSPLFLPKYCSSALRLQFLCLSILRVAFEVRSQCPSLRKDLKVPPSLLYLLHFNVVGPPRRLTFDLDLVGKMQHLVVF